MDLWNSKTYSQFLELRTRPARDLLSAVPDHVQPKTVYDLGCGPGNSTILLKNRWPQANVVGLDDSPDMLKEAKATYPHLRFMRDKIEQFAPPEKIDFLFANASLQWLPAHEQLFPKLLRQMVTGGAFGIQMPNNFHSPTHQVVIQLLQSNPAWRPLLTHLRYGFLKEPLYTLPWYYELLIKSGMQHLQLWETEYLQEMQDHQAIFDWIKGTGLRPVLTKMDTATQTEFASAYVHAIAKEYPLQTNHKILLPYKRLFMIGFKT